MENNEFNLVISLLKNHNQGRSNKSFSLNENNLTFHLKSKKDDIKFPDIPPMNTMNKTTNQALFHNPSNINENINNNIISPNLINSIINDNNNNKNNNNNNNI